MAVKTFRASVLIALLLLTQTAASAQEPADAKGPAQEKSREAQKPEAGKKAVGEPDAKSKQAEAEGKCAGPVVLLRAVLDKSGEVRDIELVKFTPKEFPEKERDELIRKAAAAAGEVKFRPAEKDGRAASQRVKLEYCFTLDDEKKE